MKWVKQILTVLVLANWFACIVHCQSEQARLTSNSVGAVRTSFVAASQANGGEDCHVCDWVATGGYKTSESRVMAPDVVTVLLPTFTPVPHSELSLTP